MAAPDHETNWANAVRLMSRPPVELSHDKADELAAIYLHDISRDDPNAAALLVLLLKRVYVQGGIAGYERGRRGPVKE